MDNPETRSYNAGAQGQEGAGEWLFQAGTPGSAEGDMDGN